MLLCPQCSTEHAEGGCPGGADEAVTPAPMPGISPRVVLKEDPATEFALGASSVLGRGATAAVRLQDREVSRRHSQIDLVDGRYMLSDLGSSNGTYLNGQRLAAPAALQDGDEILIGVTRLEFRLSRGATTNAEIVHGAHLATSPRSSRARSRADRQMARAAPWRGPGTCRPPSASPPTSPAGSTP